jgi:hypothetical protein
LGNQSSEMQKLKINKREIVKLIEIFKEKLQKEDIK